MSACHHAIASGRLPAAALIPVFCGFVLACLGLHSDAFGAVTSDLRPGAAGVKVRYLSADYVYLDGGRADSLSPGDSLLVMREGETVARGVIEHAAEHSAACRIVVSLRPVLAGDFVRLVGRTVEGPAEARAAQPAQRSGAPADPTTGAAAASDSAAPAGTTARPESGTAAAAPESGATAVPPTSAALNPPFRRPEVSGFAALQWYRFSDQSGLGFDFDQPTARLQVKARRLLGRDLTFQMKGRLRHEHRNRRSGGSVPTNRWNSRIYALALSYDAPQALLNWQIGRVTGHPLAATGPVDGLLAEILLARGLRAGLFAGALPEDRDSAPRAGIQKYGIFTRAARGRFETTRWSGAIGGIADYHGSTVSRQYAFLQGEMQAGRRFSLYENAELDFNGGWRRERSTGRISLSNAYVSGNYRPTAGTSLGFSYDNRRNYHSWESRSIPDSLFDLALRSGVRLNASMVSEAGWSAYGTGGRQHRQGDRADTWSWAAGAGKDRLFGQRLRIAFRGSGFSGPWASGSNPSLEVLKAFAEGHQVLLSGGAYVYRLDADGSRRRNGWVRVDGRAYVSARCYFSGELERDWGADMRGVRLIAETGFSF